MSTSSRPTRILSEENAGEITELPWGPIYKQHILNCSYSFWHPLYRKDTPKARLIPLTQPFLDYLGEDGIFVPPDDEEEGPTWDDADSGVFSEDKSDDEDEEDATVDPSQNFREIHQKIKEIIDELGGRVAPKLNWSAPKDATWIGPSNSMECWRPSDVYLLLKSSDFITHDLEYPFAGCVDEEGSNSQITKQDIPYHLILRKYLNFNPSLEFRCFVKKRTLLGICQRDMNHFGFLFGMVDDLGSRIEKFFEDKLKFTFPDENFTFDVYIPPPHKRVWLIDINPWAPRTDPLLFSWLELLLCQVDSSAEIVAEASEEKSDSNEAENPSPKPDFRLIKKDDPEAYNFATPQYSAHKLPREVVDASNQGAGGIREFAEQWQQIVQQQGDANQV